MFMNQYEYLREDLIDWILEIEHKFKRNLIPKSEMPKMKRKIQNIEKAIYNLEKKRQNA